MLRIICKESDATQTVCAGGHTGTWMRTFVVDAPEVEAWLNEFAGVKGHDYNLRSIVGVEVIPPCPPGEGQIQTQPEGGTDAEEEHSGSGR